jgi:hypothetical protein
MSEQTSQEPTMEEILASIRRIISEDEAPPAEEAETAPAATEEPAALQAEPEPEPEPPPPAAEPEPVAAAPEPEPAAVEEEALELTDKVETHGDLDVVAPAAPLAAEPEPQPQPAPAESLVGERAATAAASAFGQLSAAIAMPRSDRTLEDVVRELLRPLLQQWLDDNLPGIVQQSVEAEVERIARGRVR